MAFPGQTGLHQPRATLGNNNLVMERDVIAVGVRNEGKRLRIPRIKPDVLVRQINPALVLDPDHRGKINPPLPGREPALPGRRGRYFETK